MATANPTDGPQQNPSENERKDPGPGPGPGASEDNQESEANRSFECNICLDTARDAVVSMCGHLFCWPCLHQWLETRPTRQICPVCKAGISKEKVIPLYGRGNSEGDPREKIPPRPQGQRSEPTTNNPFSGFGFGGGQPGGGFHMSFGIGAFPFGFFASNFNFGEERPGAPGPGSHQALEEAFLHKVFLWVAFAFIFWLLIA